MLTLSSFSAVPDVGPTAAAAPAWPAAGVGAGRSLLMWSVGERLLGALGLLAGLWLGVVWALN